jgi:signal transduction histidine kinase
MQQSPRRGDPQRPRRSERPEREGRADPVDDESQRRDYSRTTTAKRELLSRLINNVLGLSRIEKSPDCLKLVLGDVAEVLRDALEVLRLHVEREGFSLELEGADSLPNVYFEPDDSNRSCSSDRQFAQIQPGRGRTHDYGRHVREENVDSGFEISVELAAG